MGKRKNFLTPKQRERVEAAIAEAKRRSKHGIGGGQLLSGGRSFDCAEARMAAGIAEDLDGEDGHE